MSPFKVDQLEINPSLTGIRSISGTSNGSLLFIDSLNPTGLLLSQLAGLQTVGHMLVVGSGAGAAYSKIQEALDDIPADSSVINPYFVFVGPGVYKETVNIVRDGVYITGYGAILQSASEDTPNGPDAYHTIVIQAALGTIPKTVVINNLPITNAHANYACVRIVGGVGSEVGSGGIVFNNGSFASTGNGRPIWATTMNRLHISNCSMVGCTGLALVYIDQCADVFFNGVSNIPNIAFSYNSASPQPIVTTSAYRMMGCSNLGCGSLSPQVQADLIDGLLSVSGCTGQSNMLFTGDSPISIGSSIVGTLTLTGTLAVRLVGCSRGTISSSGGATLSEPCTRGAASFIGATTAAVVFTTAQPDSLYEVTFEENAVSSANWFITGKSGAGFTINYGSAQTLAGVWTTSRVV